MKKPILALILALTLVLTLALPLGALAAEDAEAVPEAVPAEVYTEPEPEPEPAPEPEPEEGPAEAPAEAAVPEAPADPAPAEEPAPGAPEASDPEETASGEPAEVSAEAEEEEADAGEPGDYASISHIEYGSAVVGWEDVSYEYDRQANLEAVYAFLREELGLSQAAACGVLANIAAESDFAPCAANSTLTSYGLCQWSGARVTELQRFCGWYGYDFHTLEGQLAFLKYELTGPRQYILDYLSALSEDAAGAFEAAWYFCYHYEVVTDRVADAESRGYKAADVFFAELYVPEEGAATEEPAEAESSFFALAGAAVLEKLTALEAAPEEEAAIEEEDPFVIDPSIGTGYFIRPVAYYDTSSNYGWRIHPIYNVWKFHAGMDIGASEGDPIVAADNGTVIISGYDSGYGNYVVIDHNDGYQTLYAHQSALAVTAGDVVRQGDVIGYVGSTGLSTGPHLHYEVWAEYETVEPAEFIVEPSGYNPY